MSSKPIHLLLFGRNPKIGTLLTPSLHPKYTFTQLTTTSAIAFELRTNAAAYQGLVLGGGLDAESREGAKSVVKEVAPRLVVVEMPERAVMVWGLEKLGEKTRALLDGVFLEGRL
ncbi:hypothetical protein HK104_004615 [Borealophlyctis nickersoniae]|nr:hypothetical protein HK104_004615 [Borealophlyctis nickersoniae]